MRPDIAQYPYVMLLLVHSVKVHNHNHNRQRNHNSLLEKLSPDANLNSQHSTFWRPPRDKSIGIWIINN